VTPASKHLSTPTKSLKKEHLVRWIQLNLVHAVS